MGKVRSTHSSLTSHKWVVHRGEVSQVRGSVSLGRRGRGSRALLHPVQAHQAMITTEGNTMTVSHGITPRDLVFPTLPPGSQLFQNRFGKLFPLLPSFAPADADLEALAATVIENATDVEEAQKPSNIHQPDTGLAAGFTYLGQFIDHDLTFDPVSQLGVNTDPNTLQDFRTPRFDLDNVYGAGPNDAVFLYDEKDRKHLLFDAANNDLQRNSANTAIIGDPAQR